jgi:uncharacterized protein YdhG (YjbR/CyaY superfamily)
MEAHTTKYESVDAYMAGFPKDIQKRLETMRRIIRKAAPNADEVISYNMPAYKLGGMLVYFAAWRSHIGFYPGTSGIAHFKSALAGYGQAKGSVRFQNDGPLPEKLVADIVRFRAAENLKKQRLKAAKKKS